MNQKKKSGRYLYVDCLRGVAALAVVLNHLFQISNDIYKNMVPHLLMQVSAYGVFGVQVFFVLSGFVIAHSLYHDKLTFKSVTNFIVRRQIRLDPTYWTVLICTWLLYLASAKIPALKLSSYVTLPQLGLNFLYLQNIFKAPNVVVVAWTLCLEIQFYIFFIGLAMLSGILSRSKAPVGHSLSSAFLIFITGVFSLWLSHWSVGYEWFIRYWFYFVAGVLGYWSFRKSISKYWFLSFAALMCVAILWSAKDGAQYNLIGYGAQKTLPRPLIVGLLTALSLWWIGNKGKLTEYGNWTVIQYLGKISYSLYLVHFGVCTMVLRLVEQSVGNSRAAWIGGATVALVLSIGVAHLLWASVEQASLRLGAKLKR